MIKYIFILLHVEALRVFNITASQNEVTSNAHLQHIIQGLIQYLPPNNALSKHTRVICRCMRKTWTLSMKCFIEHLT